MGVSGLQLLIIIIIIIIIIKHSDNNLSIAKMHMCLFRSGVCILIISKSALVTVHSLSECHILIAVNQKLLAILGASLKHIQLEVQREEV